MCKTLALKALMEALGRPPPIAAWSKDHVSCITQRWTHPPFSKHLPPMSTHIIAVHYTGAGVVEYQSGPNTLVGRPTRGTITVIPEGQAGDLRLTDPFDGVYVLISQEHLRAIAATISLSHTPRLLPCVGSPEPVLFELTRMIQHCAGLSESAMQALLERMLDAFCTQLLRSQPGELDFMTSEPRHSRSRPTQVARVDA